MWGCSCCDCYDLVSWGTLGQGITQWAMSRGAKRGWAAKPWVSAAGSGYNLSTPKGSWVDENMDNSVFLSYLHVPMTQYCLLSHTDTQFFLDAFKKNDWQGCFLLHDLFLSTTPGSAWYSIIYNGILYKRWFQGILCYGNYMKKCRKPNWNPWILPFQCFLTMFQSGTQNQVLF